jgi:hypothetical protein
MSHSGGLSEWQAFIGFGESDCCTSAAGESGHSDIIYMKKSLAAGTG